MDARGVYAMAAGDTARQDAAVCGSTRRAQLVDGTCACRWDMCLPGAEPVWTWRPRRFRGCGTGWPRSSCRSRRNHRSRSCAPLPLLCLWMLVSPCRRTRSSNGIHALARIPLGFPSTGRLLKFGYSRRGGLASASLGRVSNRLRACSTVSLWTLAQSSRACSGSISECPSAVSRYCTAGGDRSSV